VKTSSSARLAVLTRAGSRGIYMWTDMADVGGFLPAPFVPRRAKEWCLLGLVEGD